MNREISELIRDLGTELHVATCSAGHVLAVVGEDTLLDRSEIAEEAARAHAAGSAALRLMRELAVMIDAPTEPVMRRGLTALLARRERPPSAQPAAAVRGAAIHDRHMSAGAE